MTKEEAYLVIDIGTGNVRVALAATDGRLLGVARQDLQNQKDLDYPEALSFDPDQLWLQITALTREAIQQAGEVQVLAITATSQREGIVLVSEIGRSIIGLPNIDHRGREWESMMLDRSRIYQLTGRYPTSLFSALKIVGLMKRKPELLHDFHSFLSISDWVEYKLSGILHYEHSQASETLLYNVEQANWSPELLNVFGIDSAVLVPLIHSGTDLGQVLKAEALALGISAEARVIVGGGDTQLAILSTCPEENDVVMVSGTTTPIIKITADYVTDTEQRTWTSRHTDGKHFILEANAGVTGLNYQRLKEIFYPNEDYAVIEQELGEISTVQCMASLGSLLADEKKALIRGGFIFDAPVSHTLTRGCFVWATLWDIACSITENYKSLCQVTTHDKDYIWACGGGAQSPLLRQFLANLLQKKVRVSANYIQSSVAGGVWICNAALGKTQADTLILDETLPQQNERHQYLYEEWKKTRSSFIAMVP